MPAPLDTLKRTLDRMGVAEVQHTRTDLLAHLVGVCEILHRRHQPDAVQHAGLFHFIYGTEGFPHATLPLAQRDTVRDLIDVPAERLVYAYCAMSYTSLQQSIETETVAL